MTDRTARRLQNDRTETDRQTHRTTLRDPLLDPTISKGFQAFLDVRWVPRVPRFSEVARVPGTCDDSADFQRFQECRGLGSAIRGVAARPCQIRSQKKSIASKKNVPVLRDPPLEDQRIDRYLVGVRKNSAPPSMRAESILKVSSGGRRGGSGGAHDICGPRAKRAKRVVVPPALVFKTTHHSKRRGFPKWWSGEDTERLCPFRR